MTLPKALLCLLDGADQKVEMNLRSSGFAAGAIRWAEVDTQPNGWTRLLEVLEDPSINAWVLAGAPESFTTELMAKVGLINLAFSRNDPPATAFILNTETAGQEKTISEALPPLMANIKVWRHTDPYGGHL